MNTLTKEQEKLVKSQPWYQTIWDVETEVCYTVSDLHELAYAAKTMGNDKLARRLSGIANRLYENAAILSPAVNKATDRELQQAQQSTANMLNVALGMAAKEMGDNELARKYAENIK